MNENRIKRLEQLLQARQREFATKWGRAALPHERLTYFPLEDLIKNNGKKQCRNNARRKNVICSE